LETFCQYQQTNELLKKQNLGIKAVEFETGLETWLFWVDILQFLGEFESAIQTLQAVNIFLKHMKLNIWIILYANRQNKISLE
jgi:hypothetical protein